jgi:hypothetical protein
MRRVNCSYMNQLIWGIVTGGYVRQDREGGVSFSFPLIGYGKVMSMFNWAKKIYNGSLFRDFQNVLTARV